MKITLHKSCTFHDIDVDYLLDEESGQIGLRLVPAALRDRVVERRATLAGTAEAAICGLDIRGMPAWQVDPLVHVSLVGDCQPGGFAAGATMRNAGSTAALRFRAQEEERDGSVHRVVTVLRGRQRSSHEFSLELVDKVLARGPCKEWYVEVGRLLEAAGLAFPH